MWSFAAITELLIFFLTWALRKLYSNTDFSGQGTIKLPTQVYITLSKIKMWKIGIYTATLEHRNSLLRSHFITSYPSPWILKTSDCCWRSCHTQPLPLSQPISSQGLRCSSFPAWAKGGPFHFCSIGSLTPLTVPLCQLEMWASPTIHRAERSTSNPGDWIHRGPWL